MPLANVGLRFSNGLVVGRWDIPSPTSKVIRSSVDFTVLRRHLPNSRALVHEIG